MMRTLQAALVVAAAVNAWAMAPLTNADVIKLSGAGLSREFILKNVQDQPPQYNTDVAGLLELKQAGVDEQVIRAMVDKQPPAEAMTSAGVVRLARAGFTDDFLVELIRKDGNRFRTDTTRIVAMREAGVSERVLSAMLEQNDATRSRAQAITIPANTEVTIRMIDSIDSEKHGAGEEFRASVADPIIVDGKEIVPQGADAVVKLVREQESGRLSGKAELTLQLVSLNVQGTTVPTASSAVTQASSSRTGRTVKTAATVGAVGAIIGAIAGGGKGAAIGAGAGAAAGAGATMVMKGQRVQVPSEALLTFTVSDEKAPR